MENIKHTVISTLSEGFDNGIRSLFEIECLKIMEYHPRSIDKANYLRIALPLFAHLAHKHPQYIHEYSMNIPSFVENISQYVLESENIDAVHWYEGLVIRFEKNHPHLT